ncbi:DUF924 family protein [Immundisolibacter sp.]|uniref:DUF924 family protein n=2 Tax=Immundisolibacter sp. TaxID=1934948 RepID=UPI000ED05116|nr:DUF924 domain-containing protein [Gammaproteobacteria bacterium]
MHDDVLAFWFEQTAPAQWWASDPAFDALIRQRYGALLQQAARGELYAWRATPHGRLAEVIVLDQFSRNIHRDTPRAFAQDGMALALAQEAVAAGVLTTLEPVQRGFVLMPYMHSESRAIHALAQPLFAAFAPRNTVRHARRHKAVIDRFGRYPHRNAVLGRPSTAEELAFLARPDSRL